VALVLLGSGSSPASGAGWDSDRPGLRVVDRDPLVLAGRRFEPRERVRLTVVSGGERHALKVRATPDGKFVARFAAVRLDRCSGSLAVSAVGSAGSRAGFRLERLHCAGAAVARVS
jgi:hypothetical protein